MEYEFDERALLVGIDDEGGGEFSISDGRGGRVSLDVGEWPLVRRAIDELAAAIAARKSQSGVKDDG